MFFTPELLQRRDSGFGLIWLAATLGSKSALRKLPRKGILSADIPQLCEMISSPPEPLALRLSANLMVGVARVYHARHDMWAADVTHTFTNLKKAINAMYMENGSIMLEMPVSTVKADMITLPPAGDRASMEFNFDFDFNFDFAAMNKDWELPIVASPAVPRNQPRITLDESHILDAANTSMRNDLDFDFDFIPAGGAGPSSSAAPRSARPGGHPTSSAGNEPFNLDFDLGLGDGAVGADGRIDLGLGLEEDGWGAGAQGWSDAVAAAGDQIDLGLGLDEHMNMDGGDMLPPSPSDHLSSAIRRDMIAGHRRKPRTLGLGDEEGQQRERTPSLTHSQESPPSGEELDALPPGAKRPGEEIEGAKKKKKRVRLLLDNRTELTDAELLANREEYVENMLAARAEAQAKAPKPWVMDLLYKDIPDGYEAPELRECFANVIESNLEARKRRWEEDENDNDRAVRRRLDGEREVERGRGGVVVYPDDELQAPGWAEQQYDDMNMIDADQPRAGTPRGILRPSLPGSVEQGRGASLLQDISQRSNAFPWDNVDVDGGPSSSWAPVNSGGPRSSDGFLGMFSPRPEGSASGLRVSRGSREGSLVPSEIGSTPRRSFSGPGGPVEDFPGFPEGQTQTQSQTQSQSQDPESLATLERNSFNFLEYLKAEHNVAQRGLPAGAGSARITLDRVLPADFKTRHVAANAFYNCLVLATKSFINLEQRSPYATIDIDIL